MLARIDRATSDIDQISQVIEQLLAPYEQQLQQVEAMPGWGRRAAQDAIAETGVDMTRFRATAHLVSWVGRSPVDQQSAGKNTRRAKVKKGRAHPDPPERRGRPPTGPGCPGPPSAGEGAGVSGRRRSPRRCLPHLHL